MTTEWLSGGFMIALAAVLWLVYLVPSWFRSRQYLATERNAVRLQQTLRILAETAEVPDEVRLEANARSIAEQERILKHRVAEQRAEAVPPAVRTADRLRRSRAVTALVFALSVVVSVFGGLQAAATGTWVILAGGIIASVISLTMLVKLARAGRRLRLPRPESAAGPSAALVDHGVYDHADSSEPAEIAVAAQGDGSAGAGWVPVAVPRPLYLTRAGTAPLALDDALAAARQASPAALSDAHLPAAATPAAGTASAADSDDRATATAHAVASAAEAHQESLRRAAAASQEALRERMRAQLEMVAELPVATPEAAAAPAPSRFARMGIVDADTSTHLDLDAVLARRRAV